ncbi:hypothetical protein AOLI_G00174340 [Acnodon oligacanthus]
MLFSFKTWCSLKCDVGLNALFTFPYLICTGTTALEPATAVHMPSRWMRPMHMCLLLCICLVCRHSYSKKQAC